MERFAVIFLAIAASVQAFPYQNIEASLEELSYNSKDFYPEAGYDDPQRGDYAIPTGNPDYYYYGTTQETEWNVVEDQPEVAENNAEYLNSMKAQLEEVMNNIYASVEEMGDTATQPEMWYGETTALPFLGTTDELPFPETTETSSQDTTFSPQHEDTTASEDEASHTTEREETTAVVEDTTSEPKFYAEHTTDSPKFYGETTAFDDADYFSFTTAGPGFEMEEEN